MKTTKTKNSKTQIQIFTLFILSTLTIFFIGIGLFFVIDISNYKYPDSKITRIKPYIDFGQSSRSYCDTYHILINFYWLAIARPEMGDEIQSFYDKNLSQNFGESKYLDGQTAYPILDYWIPVSKSKFFFLDVVKVYSGAWTDKYGPVAFVYSIDTRIYVGIFPKINNSCPDHG